MEHKEHRNKKGQFRKACCCINHVSNKSRLIDKKRIKKHLFEKLKKKNMINFSSKSICICDACIMKNTDERNYESSVGSNDEQDEMMIESTNNVISSFEISKDLEKEISNDITLLFKSKPCKKMHDLKEYNAKKWVSERPKNQVSMISQIANLDAETDYGSVKVASIIENIYSCRNKFLVLPSAFRHNLLTYSYSNSRMLVDINGKNGPSGGYSYLSNWLDAHARDQIKVPEGFVRIIFDNEQVVGKKYKVRAESNAVKVSVVTSTAYLKIDSESKIQENENFKPRNWLYGPLETNEKYQLKSSLDEYSSYFRMTRNTFLMKRLSIVYKEQEFDSENIYDEVDNQVFAENEINNEKLCTDCNSSNDPSFRICTACGGTLSKVKFKLQIQAVSKDNQNPYNHFSVRPQKNDISVIVGEPIMLNPNGFENISTILRTIGIQAGVKKYAENGKRSWLMLENDGAIHTIITKLIANVLYCSECDKSIYGIENFYEHTCVVMRNVLPQHEFDWIILLPGLLHLEMNAGKSFMRLNWDTFMESIAKKLGFVSEIALKFIHKGSDHHKLWEILEITYLSVTDELLLPYVRYCISNKKVPCIDGYWDYSQKVECPNYIFTQQMILTYLHSLMLYRTGTRNNDFLSILAAKSKLCLLFFGGNHPLYRDIVYNDLKLRQRMSQEIAEKVNESLVTSRTNTLGAYQGGDAILEEINKNAKQWVIGVPTDIQWRKSFRNLDHLSEIREKTLADVGIREDKEYIKKFDFDKEIFYIRMLFRKEKYLLSPLEKKSHKGLSGKKLCEELSKFSDFARTNFEAYIECEGEQYEHKTIYITEEDAKAHRSIENLTMPSLKEKILCLIQSLNEMESALYYEYFMKVIKNKTKSWYLDFYRELENLVTS